MQFQIQLQLFFQLQYLLRLHHLLLSQLQLHSPLQHSLHFNCCPCSCSSPIPSPLRRHMVKRCPGLLVALPHFTHLSWEFMKLPPGSEANQRTTLSTARTVDAEQRTTRGGGTAGEGEGSNKNAIYLLIYPRSIKYVKSTKQRGASRTARLPRCLRRRLMLAMQEQEDQELERSMVTCAASGFKLLVSRFV